MYSISDSFPIHAQRSIHVRQAALAIPFQFTHKDVRPTDRVLTWQDVRVPVFAGVGGVAGDSGVAGVSLVGGQSLPLLLQAVPVL